MSVGGCLCASAGHGRKFFAPSEINNDQTAATHHIPNWPLATSDAGCERPNGARFRVGQARRVWRNRQRPGKNVRDCQNPHSGGRVARPDNVAGTLADSAGSQSWLCGRMRRPAPPGPPRDGWAARGSGREPQRQASCSPGRHVGSAPGDANWACVPGDHAMSSAVTWCATLVGFPGPGRQVMSVAGRIGPT